RRIAARVRAWFASSAWAPLAGKVALWSVGFFLLALVGSGKLLTWVPAVRAGSVAYAATTTPPPPAAPQDDAGPADAGEDGGVKEKINLNLATESDLRRLPGVGPKKAQAILELRAKLGRFTKVEELLRVKGIGRRSLARLRPLVVVE